MHESAFQGRRAPKQIDDFPQHSALQWQQILHAVGAGGRANIDTF
jgi:hypothetical protein